MSRSGTQPGSAADAFQLARSRARVLALQLRLRLTDLKTIESWADETILEDGAPPAIADLCLATRAGERITQRILDDLGGPVGSVDVMRRMSSLWSLLPATITGFSARSAPSRVSSRKSASRDFSSWP